MSVDVPVSNQNSLMGINENEGMKYYDIFPKMQFHGEGNDPTDGNNVLVFLSGFKDVEGGRTNPISYYLSDDNAYQTIYNDGTPCWLFTPSETISGVQLTYKVRYLPVFERYLTNNGSGTINKSLDFGTPQELFIPDYSITEDVNLYSNFWQSYLEDLFDPDTKVLECYVHIRGKIGDEWMRRFYWFDNAVWRLNKVTDWAVGELGTTQMEFVRVQDINGYNSVTQHAATRVSLSSNCYAVDYTGDTITLTVGISNGGSWRLTATDGAILSRSNGMGNGTVTVTIPTNNSSGLKYWYFTVTSDDGATARCTISQSYDGETDFRCDPEDLIIPASGGNAFVNFIWTNQGEEYIQSVDFNESYDYLQFTADLDTYRTQNKALLGFSANTGTTVLHNYCQFQSREGIRHSIGIDQVPDILQFAESGGSTTLSFDYNSAVTITAPEWIDVTKSGNTFTITARPNLYESENNSELVITSGKKSVKTAVRQTAGSGGGSTPNKFEVSPSNLYFTSGGGTQYITVTATQSWYYKPFGGEWWSLSTSNGNGNMTVALTAPTNSGSARSNYAEFGSIINGVEVVKTVYVTQDASGSTPSFSSSVSPNTTTIAQSGESVNYTITVSSMNGLHLEIDASRDGDYANATIGNVTWQGNTGYVTITYPANDVYLAQRTWSILFNFKQGNTLVGTYGMMATQDGSQTEYWNGGGQNLGDQDNDGGNVVINHDTNTCWYTESGELVIYGISLDTTNGDNAYIDTGIVPNSGYTMRLKYRSKGVENGGVIFGTNEGNDNRDWRWFMPTINNASTGWAYVYFDYNAERTSSLRCCFGRDGYKADITMTQNTIYNKIYNGYIFDKRNDWGDNPWLGSGSIVVDTKSVIVEEFWVWDENHNLVFHGIPYPRTYEEYEINRTNRTEAYGLWDTVTNRLFGLSSAYTGNGELRAHIEYDETQDWFTVTSSGCGSDALTLTMQPNTTPFPRWGGYNVYSQATNQDLNDGYGYRFRQDGNAENLVVSPTSLVFDSNGGTATFTITSNTNWTIE